MKFGRLLREATVNMPEMDRLSQAYKQLKKKIKALERCNMEVESIASARDASPSPTCSRETDSGTECSKPIDRMPPANGKSSAASDQVERCVDDHSVAHGRPEPTSAQAQEQKFAEALAETLGDFNDWFLQREEESVLQLDELTEESSDAKTEVELAQLLLRLEVFHSEALRLLHWSVVAYNSIVKILKKHCKHTGGLLRNQSMDNIVAQPFCCTTEISGLVRGAEATIGELKARRGRLQRERAASPSSGSVLAWSLGPTGSSITHLHQQQHWQHTVPPPAAVATGPMAHGALLSLNSAWHGGVERDPQDAGTAADGLRKVPLSLALRSSPSPVPKQERPSRASHSPPDLKRMKTEGGQDSPVKR